MEFSQNAQTEFDDLLTRYPTKMAATLPTLHLIQKEFGFVSDEGIEYAAKILEQSVAHVHNTVTFYTMYFRKKMGDNIIEVCSTLSCALCGAKKVAKHLENKFGIKFGETTPDNKFSLLKAECLGSCGTAPVIKINNDYYENIPLEKLDEILDKL